MERTSGYQIHDNKINSRPESVKRFITQLCPIRKRRSKRAEKLTVHNFVYFNQLLFISVIQRHTKGAFLSFLIF